MGSIIQICGFPRSGTAFVSAFLNLHTSCIAYHELALKVDNSKELLYQKSKEYQFVVDVSTYAFLESFVIKDSKKIFIKKDIQQSKLSLESAIGIGGLDYIYDTIQENVSNWLVEYQVPIIRFDSLFEIKTLRKIWQYCFQSDDFPEEKALCFIDMNIQMKNPSIVLDSEIVNRFQKQNTLLCQQ